MQQTALEQRFRVDKVGRINRTIENPRIFVALPSISPREAGGIPKFRASEYHDKRAFSERCVLRHFQKYDLEPQLQE